MGEPSPFTIRKMLVLEGGYGKTKSMQLACETCDGIDLIKLCARNRNLAVAMGQKTTKDHYWKNCDIMQHMRDMRNEAVDRFIKQNIHSSDPFADCPVTEVEITAANRARLFADTKVPQIVDVVFPSFTTPEGKRVEATTIKMLSTPKKPIAPSMECTSENLSWFLYACKHSWIHPGHDTQAVSKKRQCEDLEEEFGIPKPARMLHFEANKVILGVPYKNPSGEWMRRQEKIDRSMFDNDEDLKAAMIKVAHRLIGTSEDDE